jgi:hypothetical protein
MNFQVVVGLLVLSAFCVHAKDGQWNSKTSSLTPTVPKASTGTGSRTYYSYSYKSPYKSPTTTQRGTANLADYAHKGATTIDSYKSPPLTEKSRAAQASSAASTAPRAKRPPLLTT